MRQPEIGTGKPGPIDAMPDPWGVRRAENLLTTLEGVLSARVVTTPLGEVSEIHVLAQAGLQPKQLVRNIESALLAHLGLKVDHRKISIAQTAEVKPLDTLERTAVRERAMQRGIMFEHVTVQTGSRPQRVVVERREGRYVFYRLVRPRMAQWLLAGFEFLGTDFEAGSEIRDAGEKTRALWTSGADVSKDGL